MTYLMRLVLGGAILWCVAVLVSNGRQQRERRHSENMLEGALEETFPASDPPATQDFSIPANRI